VIRQDGIEVETLVGGDGDGTAFIPYHRVLRVLLGEKVIWRKHPLASGGE
jgi:uncharacterized protein (UPF0248 family)